MPPRASHLGHPVFCIWCGAEVPLERVRLKAITCCKEHAQDRRNFLRQRVDLKRCRYCMQPCTPEELADFRQWRRERNRQLSTASNGASAVAEETIQ